MGDVSERSHTILQSFVTVCARGTSPAPTYHVILLCCTQGQPSMVQLFSHPVAPVPSEQLAKRKSGAVPCESFHVLYVKL